MLFAEFKKRPEQVSKKSCDMWSFGVILWELFTREVPFGEYAPMHCGMMVSSGSNLGPLGLLVHLLRRF